MKTILSLSTIAVLATVLLTGCNKSDSNYNSDSTNSSSSMMNSNTPPTNSVMGVTNLPAGTN
jgi:hypothetical protein